MDNDYKKVLLISKEREIFRDIYHDRLDQIQRSSDDIDYNNLNYKVMSSGKEYKFDRLKDPLVFLNDIKQGKISITRSKEYTKRL